MKRIISQNLDMDPDQQWERVTPEPTSAPIPDFTDKEVQRLDGAIVEATELLQQARRALADIRTKNPHISYDEIKQDTRISYYLRQTGFMISQFIQDM